MAALWTIAANPRRKARKSRKHRTAAQRAATARMLAANRARRGGSAKRRTRRSPARARTVVVHANPRRAARRASPRRSARRSSARASMASFGNSLVGYLKTGAAGAGGALVVDAGYGFLASMLPVSMQSKTDATTGGINYMYYAGKGALATAVGAFGPKIMPARIAHAMAAGSFVVMMYEIIRPMVAQALPTVNLGWFNPAPTQSLGAYANTSPRLGAYADSGAKVSAIVSPMARTR